MRVVGFESTDLRGLCEELEGPLNEDTLVCVPTSSGYVLLASTYSEQAAATLRRLRGLSGDVALQVLIPVGRMMAAFAYVTDSASTIARAFWPGMVSVILDSDKREIAGPQVLLRQPRDPLLEQLMLRVGPLFASRAVLGGVDARSLEVFQSVKASKRVAVFVDSGPLEELRVSAIVDCRQDPPVLRREGAVGLADLRSIIPSLVIDELALGPGPVATDVPVAE